MKRKGGTSKSSAANRRALFVEAMLTNGGNQTQAAIAAGYSEKSAHVRGAELVKDSKVLEMIETRRAAALEKAQRVTDLTVEEVLASLARDLRFDPAKLFYTEGPDKGKLKQVWEMDEDTRLALRGVEFDEIAVGSGAERVVVGRTAKVKQPEKTAAREQGMKHFGLYAKDNAQKPKPTTLIGVLTVPQEALSFDKVRARVLKLAA